MSLDLGYHMVPKDPLNNLKFRDWIWKKGIEDPGFARYVKEVCRRDILFYFNTFFWTNDPRKVADGQQPCIPFITYVEFQDDVILDILSDIQNGNDRLLLKSRDVGASWMALGTFDHQYRFEQERIFLCISKKEDNVDLKDDATTLFAKLDYIEERLPQFLRIKNRARSLLRMANPETRSVIVGESSNPNAGRSGRSTAVLRDEEAFCDNGLAIDKSLADNTRCQLRVSTPNGTGNSYYLAWVSGKIKITKIHWSQHPEKNPGLYMVKDRKVTILDKKYKFGKYEFVVDLGDGIRSPWYDAEVERRASKIAVAQELDCDFLASGSQFFDSLTLQLLKKRDSRPPILSGDVEADEDGHTPIILDKGFGPLSLWINLDAVGRPPQETTYCGGTDISAGTGASNSVFSIADNRSGEKVAEFTSSNLSPEGFADVVILLLKAFSTPYGACWIGWEGNGPGQIFGKKLLQTHRWHNYYSSADEGNPKAKKKTKGRPGWWSNPNAKQLLLSNYRESLAAERFINRSEAALDECEEYIYNASGTVEHSRTRGNEDNSANSAQHGDRVIADAICNMGLSKQSKVKNRPKPNLRNGLAARRAKRLADNAKQGERKWY